MKNTTFFVILLVASGCCSTRHIATSSSDSTRIEVRWRTEYVPDTLFVEVPVQSEKVTTLSDSSHLENDYAQSDARINEDGSLFHSLDTKPQKKPMPVERPVEYRDSLVYRDKEIIKTVEVERDLSWWQQTQMKGFWLLLSVVAVVIGLKLLPVIRRFI
jgi:hypothetical protein